MDLKELDKYIDYKNFDPNLKRDVGWLIKDLSNNPTKKQVKKLKKDVEKLKNGTPLAYVLGFVPFLDCNIFVDKNTLIPRPETELLVDILIKKYKSLNNNLDILDLCCGSGCIGITLSKNLNCLVDCSDISKKALKKAKQNIKENNVKVNLINSNMFSQISKKYDLIVSNPPYIEKEEISKLDKSVKDFEPILALDGGSDGLNFYKIIAEKAPLYLKENGVLALEIGFNQAKDIKNLLKTNFMNIKIIKDYSNLDRFIIAERRQIK